MRVVQAVPKACQPTYGPPGLPNSVAAIYTSITPSGPLNSQWLSDATKHTADAGSYKAWCAVQPKRLCPAAQHIGVLPLATAITVSQRVATMQRHGKMMT
jgi:hypothetical protein